MKRNGTASIDGSRPILAQVDATPHRAGPQLWPSPVVCRTDRSLASTVASLDRAVSHLVGRYGFLLLRCALALVFIWFGLLKVTGSTPVTSLLASIVPWINADLLVPSLGLVEIIIGLGLLFGVARPVILPLFVLQMLGTFLVLLIRPDVSFQHGNLLLLTMEGEFVVKNVVLLAAGLLVQSRMTLEDRRSTSLLRLTRPARTKSA